MLMLHPHPFLLLLGLLLPLTLHCTDTINGWRTPTLTERQFSPRVSCDFDTIDYTDDSMTVAKFQNIYQNKKPVLLRGYGNAFINTQRAIKREHFLNTFGKLLVDTGLSSRIVQVYGHGDEQETLSSYLKKARARLQPKQNSTMTPGKEFPYTFFNFQRRPNTSNVYYNAAGIVDDFRTVLVGPLDETFHEEKRRRTCTSSNNNTCSKFQLPEMYSYFLLVGTTNSAVNFHTHGNAWNLLLAGEKRWTVYPPGSLEADYERGLAYLGHVHWLKTILPRQMYQPYHCHQMAGDVLYIPEGFIHAVLNMGETLGVALQMNARTTKLGILEQTLSTQLNKNTTSNVAALQMLSNLITYHENTYSNPSLAQKNYLSMLYLDRARMKNDNHKYLESIEDADKAMELNINNIEAHLMFAENAGMIDSWDVQMKRLRDIHARDPSFALGSMALVAHFLKGCDTGHITTNARKKSELFLEMLDILVNAIKAVENKALHLVNNKVALKSATRLYSLVGRLSVLMHKHGKKRLAKATNQSVVNAM
jgi:hypothetical protein